MSSAPIRRNKQWQVIDVIKWGEQYFSEKGFENPRHEIEWLLTDLLSLSRIDLYLKFDLSISQHDLSTLKSWVKRRLSREPLQYITGKTEFYSLPFYVNSDVIIPRPETETVVEIAIERSKRIGAKKIVDVGTGSGCIAIALASRLDDVQILAVDKSESALKVAHLNGEKNGVSDKIEFLHLDILKNDFPGTCDLLVSNPPYVKKDEVNKLMPDIRDHEPLHALTDGADGLIFYRRFAELALEKINRCGAMILETGFENHPLQVAEIFRKSNIGKVTLHKDLNGNNRVLTVEMPQ
ncbi:MAG: peptide chain release factor N(5)-glutamine methyltransferase [Candidatus Marinimicrobia bacterium]|nr:peptide chain release factor N(5)-glutamine methyltransferase [Candidatus Neomarinimicrobiota bacterium]